MKTLWTIALTTLVIVALVFGMIKVKEYQIREIEKSEAEKFELFKVCLDQTKKPVSSEFEIFDAGQVDWCYDNFLK